MRRILPFHEGNLRKQFPPSNSMTVCTWLRSASPLAIRAGFKGIFIPNEPGRLGRPSVPTRRVKRKPGSRPGPFWIMVLNCLSGRHLVCHLLSGPPTKIAEEARDALATLTG
jgi:hypothetical protein